MARMIDADDLIARLRQAERSLTKEAMKQDVAEGYTRLFGKERGVRLARSYVEEMLRQSA